MDQINVWGLIAIAILMTIVFEILHRYVFPWLEQKLPLPALPEAQTENETPPLPPIRIQIPQIPKPDPVTVSLPDIDIPNPVHVAVEPSYWEYKLIFYNPDTTRGAANKLGAEGWELVGVSDKYSSVLLFFKRPIPPETKADTPKKDQMVC